MSNKMNKSEQEAFLKALEEYLKETGQYGKKPFDSLLPEPAKLSPEKLDSLQQMMKGKPSPKSKPKKPGSVNR